MRCELLGERSCEAMGFFIACFSQCDKHSGQKETILLTVSCNTGPAPHLRACLSLILARCLHCSEAFSLSTTCCKLIYMKCTDENLRSSCFCLAPTPIFELSTFPDHGHGAMWMQCVPQLGKTATRQTACQMSAPQVFQASLSFHLWARASKIKPTLFQQERNSLVLFKRLCWQQRARDRHSDRHCCRLAR